MAAPLAVPFHSQETDAACVLACAQMALGYLKSAPRCSTQHFRLTKTRNKLHALNCNLHPIGCATAMP